MFLEDLVNSTSSGNEHVRQCLEPQTYEALRGWAEKLREEASSSSSTATTEDAMNAGWFAAKVEHTAQVIEDLYKAYSQVGSIGRGQATS